MAFGVARSGIAPVVTCFCVSVMPLESVEHEDMRKAGTHEATRLPVARDEGSRKSMRRRSGVLRLQKQRYPGRNSARIGRRLLA
jgi:hypothetical protein